MTYDSCVFFRYRTYDGRSVCPSLPKISAPRTTSSKTGDHNPRKDLIEGSSPPSALGDEEEIVKDCQGSADGMLCDRAVTMREYFCSVSRCHHEHPGGTFWSNDSRHGLA